MAILSASILAANFAALGEDSTDALRSGADWLHIDVMDGHFVPNLSYGAPVLKSLYRALPQAFYDVHLMISDPLKYLPDFAAAGASLITFHLEAVAPPMVPQVIEAIHDLGCKAGISLRPGTSVEQVFPYLADLQLVLVMSVEPGFGGQHFMPETPRRIAVLRHEAARHGLTPHIEVDGGVNAETAPLCTAAGADVLVAGSAFFGAPDRKAAAAGIKGL